jgi:elongation factor Ts
LLRAEFAGAPGQSTAQVVRGLIGKLGENIIVWRAGRCVADAESVVAGYVHAGAVAGTYRPDEGRVGVLVKLQAQGNDLAQRPALLELAHDLALHIAAGKPRYVGAADMPAEVLDEERQRLRDELAGDSKPDTIKAKIIAGRLAKFTQAACLLEQPYLKDDTCTVEQFLAQKSAELGGRVSVESFVRLEAGE